MQGVVLAKIRTIKPSMTTDEKLAEVSRDAELLFILSLMFVDDAGRMEYSPKRLKMQAFPSDRDRELDIGPLVEELCEYRLFVVYEVGGRMHLCIPNFLKHQRIHKPTPSTIPSLESVARNRGEKPGEQIKNREKAGNTVATGENREELEVEREVELEVEEPVRDPIANENLDQQVNEVGHEYPRNDHLRGVFLPRDQQEAIAEAIIQDGFGRVYSGTVAIRDAVATWPAHEKKFVPNAGKFYREKQYLKNPAIWERSDGQPGKAQRDAESNLGAVVANRNRGDRSGSEVRQAVDSEGDSGLGGNPRKASDRGG